MRYLKTVLAIVAVIAAVMACLFSETWLCPALLVLACAWLVYLLANGVAWLVASSD